MIEKEINVDLDESVIKERLSKLEEFEPKIKKGYLSRYSKLVSSADEGAVLK
jgi:dihydroxy-acid dehydratase